MLLYKEAVRILSLSPPGMPNKKNTVVFPNVDTKFDTLHMNHASCLLQVHFCVKNLSKVSVFINLLRKSGYLKSEYLFTFHFSVNCFVLSGWHVLIFLGGDCENILVILHCLYLHYVFDTVLYFYEFFVCFKCYSFTLIKNNLAVDLVTVPCCYFIHC